MRRMSLAAFLLATSALPAMAQTPAAPSAPLTAPAAETANATAAGASDAARVQDMQRQLEEMRKLVEQLSAQPAPATPPAPAAEPAVKMGPGLVARVVAVGERGLQPDDEMGTFIAKSFPVTLNAHQREVPSQGNVGYVMEGYYLARVAGRHTFSVSISHPGGIFDTSPNCAVEVRQGEASIATATVKGISMTPGGMPAPVSNEAIGSIQVDDPGAVPMTVNVGCIMPEQTFRRGAADAKAKFLAATRQVSVTLRVRAPGDRAPREIAGSFVHRAD